MLNFKLFGIPIRVHWMFWIVAALLGGIARPDMTPEKYKMVVVWIGVCFISILWHELGHALTARKYGSRPNILLYGLGGLAINSGGRTRRANLHIIAAGPGFGLLLGGVSWLIWHFVLPPAHEMNNYLWALFTALLWINIVWSLVNLLPVLPLDGGQFLENWMHHRNPRLRGQIGCGVAIAVALFGILNRQIYIGIMFGLLAYYNYQVAEGRRVKFF